ncbi:hypothetical protein RhiJN_02802 [Ceratobasidium sp. AG-Ba]|nr:hypothetical protein RhiJN_02802 [Ceratobasidium sp. AG-Ba]
MSASGSKAIEMISQRERSNSTSSGSSDPPIDNTSSDEAMSDPGTDSDSDGEIIAALLRPITPSRNLVDRTGPVLGDVAIPRGRTSYTPVAAPALPVQHDEHLPEPGQGGHQ